MNRTASKLRILAPLLVVLSFALTTIALAKDKEEAAMKTEIPVCDKKIGTLAVKEPEDHRARWPEARPSWRCRSRSRPP